MLFDFFLFFLCLGALTFSFSGYLISLALIRVLRKRESGDNCMDYAELAEAPFINFIVPTFNEALLVQNKLRNIASLDYPAAKKRVWICDGGSSDSTMAEIEKARITLRGLELRVLVAPQPGKIGQLNLALDEIPADEIVIVTDADAVIHTKDALWKCAAALTRHAEIGLIGGWTNPDEKNSLQAEIAHWDKQNRARYLETISYSASIVVAPFYAFRRGLIGQFPEDCVADDIYISYAAHLQRLRVLYTPAILVTELRSPASLRQMCFHKFRKAHAYTSELFRALYRLPYMNKRLKYFYLTKLFQFFYLPWAFLLLFIETCILAGAGYMRYVAVFYALFLLLVLLASYVMKPPPGLRRGGINLISFVASLQVFILMNLVLVLNSLVFPFWRQDSSYEKVGAP